MATVRSRPFAGELRALVERLNARLFDRMQAERNAERRARIALFPGQVASLEPVLMDFLQAAFGGTRDDPAPLLRGVYFTSGTQEGTPIDRLTGTLARALGVDQTRTQSLQPVQGRSYFLERLLKEVIFGEAMLVAHSPGRHAAPAACCGSPAMPSPPCWSWRRPRCCGTCAAPASARSTRPRRRSPTTNRPRAA